MRIVQLRLLSFFLLLVTSLTFSADKQIEVTNFYAKLYLAPSINAKFMGLAQRGERYPILISSNYWYRIDFKGVPVWIQKSDIQLIDPNAPPSENVPVATNNTSPPQEVGSSTVAPPSTVSNTEPLPPKVVPAQPQAGSGSQLQSARSNVTDEQIRVAETRAAEMRRARIQDSIEQVAKEKREQSRLNFSKLPVVEQNVEEEQTDKVFLITVSPSKVLFELSPTSPILGIVSKGDKLQLVGEGELWCKVMYKGSIGWIEKRSGKVIIPGT
ncbi:MAG: SH3 domain-containing protein, partial [Fibrobacterota bacterium]